MQIYYQQKKDGHYRWAWKDSAEKGVFGRVKTFDDVKNRSARMFPNEKEFEFIPFEIVEGKLVPLVTTGSIDRPGQDG